uniref:Toxin candidate TRINITY_DN28445_c0_g1_i1 n=1 Tax=Pachycerianthus borealis TaxID=2736680 RepID=A0A7G7WZ72_9CNID|nr:toxin candidate TRINITY_DN28445_c0_g1_i1 [Pachycerianthus borealis]
MRWLVNLFSLFIVFMVVEHVFCKVNEERRTRQNPKKQYGEPKVPRVQQPRPRSPEIELRNPTIEQDTNELPIDILERLQSVRSTTDLLKAFGGEKFIKTPVKSKPRPLKPKKELQGKLGGGRIPKPDRNGKVVSEKKELTRELEDPTEDFENQYCSPRPNVVHVEQPKDESGFIFPFCVKLQRCTGCCSVTGNIQHCAPVAERNVTFTGYKVTWATPSSEKRVSVMRPASMRLLDTYSAQTVGDQPASQGGKDDHHDDDDDDDDDDDYDKKHHDRPRHRDDSYKRDTKRRTRREARATSQNIEEITITMPTHTQCGCKCTLDPSACNPRQQFVERHCRCECGKQERCKESFQWDDEECKCVCSQKINVCKSTMYWDREICACKCWTRSCKKGKIQNPKTCRCVYPTNRRRNLHRLLAVG